MAAFDIESINKYIYTIFEDTIETQHLLVLFLTLNFEAILSQVLLVILRRWVLILLLNERSKSELQMFGVRGFISSSHVHRVTLQFLISILFAHIHNLSLIPGLRLYTSFFLFLFF